MTFFRKLFETVQFKSGGFVSLAADNGMLLASSPDSVGHGELAALTAAPAGALEYFSPRDSVNRVSASNHLSHYPMTAMIAQNSSAVLDEWYGQLQGTHPTSAALFDAGYFAKRVTLSVALRSSGDAGRGFGRVGAAAALVAG
jgi:hypothetical protein